MSTLSFLQDDMVLIVPSSLKTWVIEQISNEQFIFRYKVITERELQKIVCFDYDVNAIVEVCKAKNVKPAIAEEYLKNMYFIDENKLYISEKLNELATLKRQLLSKNVIWKDHLFQRYFLNKKIIVYGFDVISSDLKLLLSALAIPYQVVENTEKKNQIRGVYAFTHIKDEVDYALYEISSLLQKGVDINHIYLANVNQDYWFYLEQYATMYHLPLEDYHQENLFSFPLVQDFLQHLKNTGDYALAFSYLQEHAPDHEVLSPLLSLINQFVAINVNEAYPTFVQKLKETTIMKKERENCIRIISLNDRFFSEEDYVFILSFNQGIYPRTIQNTDFLSDEEKMELKRTTSVEENKNAKERLAKTLKKAGHFYLSYKMKSSFSSYTRSFLFDDLSLEEKTYQKDYQQSYAPLKDQLDVAVIYDEVYQEVNDPATSILCSNYEIPYRKYDNQYQQIDPDKIRQYMNEKQINLSYSALNNYYQCGFKYYLNNLLKIGNYQGNSATDIGNLFHEVLQRFEQSEFDFDTYYDQKYMQFDDISTRFYAKKLKETLRKICKINQENKQYTQLTQILCEKKVEVVYHDPITIHFKGFIDKMMYRVIDDKTYVAIIDYKTGNPDIDLKKVDFGLSLQLPIYLYLLKHTDQFQNVVIAGFYLQKLLNETNKAGEDETESLKQSIKLQGYSTADLSVLSRFDKSYEKSEVIKSMSMTKDGKFSSYAKVLSEEEMNALAEKVENKVKEAIDKICDAQFSINPKIYDKKNVSCDFCDFKNCCFTTFEDRVYLNGKSQDDEEGEDD